MLTFSCRLREGDLNHSPVAGPGTIAALPAGARYYKNASFNHMGKITFWWTASKNDKWNAWYTI